MTASLAAALLAAASQGGVRAASPSCALYLTTLPAGADVWIDGSYVGRSPVLVDGLARGHHAATLTKAGWAVQEVDVDVSAGTTLTSLRLHAAAHGGGADTGTVTFRGLAAGAKVAIDGEQVTRDPRVAAPLSAGTHLAVVTTPAGKLARMFTVYAGTETEVLLTRETADQARSAIVAPAEEFLPSDAYKVEGKRVVVRYGGHEVTGRIGELPLRYDGVTVSYDAAPSMINGRLYLPFALLSRLTQTSSK